MSRTPHPWPAHASAPCTCRQAGGCHVTVQQVNRITTLDCRTATQAEYQRSASQGEHCSHQYLLFWQATWERKGPTPCMLQVCCPQYMPAVSQSWLFPPTLPQPLTCMSHLLTHPGSLSSSLLLVPTSRHTGRHREGSTPGMEAGAAAHCDRHQPYQYG
jgi:hypothetical protein